jgi:protease-4
MMKRLFRQEHPVLTGCLLLGLLMVVFWGGITFFVGSLLHRPGKGALPHKEGIGVVELTGVIIAADETIAQLTEFREQKNIRAIVLRIDSPGGAVGASQELYEEVRRTNAVKPVVASMGSVAASGGLYAALGAGRIVANPGTLTGSMGVILKFANLEELFHKIGYKSEVVKSGRLKDIGSPSRPLNEEEREMLQTMIDDVHGQFVKAVAESRKLPEEAVHAVADGRIFSGAQARELKLIDQFGNLNDAVLLAAELAGMDTTTMPKLIYPEQHDFSLWSLLAGAPGRALLDKTRLQTPVLAYEWTVSPL